MINNSLSEFRLVWNTNTLVCTLSRLTRYYVYPHLCHIFSFGFACEFLMQDNLVSFLLVKFKKEDIRP
jgi:hypothetical protein